MNIEEKKRIVSIIEDLRIQSKMTKKDLAEKAGINYQQFTRLVNHGTNPELITIIACLDAVGHRIDIISKGEPKVKHQRCRMCQGQTTHTENGLCYGCKMLKS